MDASVFAGFLLRESFCLWLPASGKASAFGFLLPEKLLPLAFCFGKASAFWNFLLLKPQPRPTFSIANPGSE